MLRVSFIRLWSVEGLVAVVAQSDVCVVVTVVIPTYTHTGRCGLIEKCCTLCLCFIFSGEETGIAMS